MFTSTMTTSASYRKKRHHCATATRSALCPRSPAARVNARARENIMATRVDSPPQPATLSKEEVLRYSRHLIMPEVGMDGQLKLKQAKVLLVGTGGLGAPLGLYLAAAGVGRLGLVDFDVVDFTNLQRQVTFGTSDVGRKKLDAAKDRLANLNPTIQIDTHEVLLSRDRKSTRL